jgi:hypothetical protein
MLVDPRKGNPRKIEALSALEHRIRQSIHFGPIQTAEVNRHEQGSDLVIGDPAVRIGRDQLAQLGWLQRLAIAFALDEAGYDHLRLAGVLSRITSHRCWSSHARSTNRLPAGSGCIYRGCTGCTFAQRSG